MSPEPQKTGKEKIEAKIPESVIIVNQPPIRNYSTGGGHLPGDTLTEGDEKITIKKWQGYPPENLNLIGKPHVAVPEVMIPRFTGKAVYATRVLLPGMLHAKVLGSPHARAKIAKLDTSKAEKMPGVKYILTPQNGPGTYPFPEELSFQGETVAIVAAETEDQAEDAAAALDIQYDILPSASSLTQAMAPNPPDLSTKQRGNVIKTLFQWGDVDKAFAQADLVKEFSYFYNGGIPFPFQPVSCAAKWDGDRLTLWGMAQGTHPQRAAVAKQLGIPLEKVRYINQWNGGTFGGANGAAGIYYPWIAHIAKMTGRPVRLILPKEQELASLHIKAQNLTKFKVGAMKDGKIIAFTREFHVNTGVNPEGLMSIRRQSGGGGRSELYMHVCPNWKEIGYLYRTNSLRTGASRSNSQQEFKWSWEQMLDELAEALNIDPVKVRIPNIPHPGTKVNLGQGGPTIYPMPETENGFLTYDDYASKEVLEEGAKAFGWEKRNPVPGGNPGRFKRGMGLAMSMHHAGRVGYQEGEGGYEWVVSRNRDGGGESNGAEIHMGELVVDGEGNVTIHQGQPDSGTNHGSSMSIQVGEILGFTTLNPIKLVWGDTDLTPPCPGWASGLTTQLTGGSLCNAADKLRKELLKRASDTLKVDASKLKIRDGVISAADDAKKRITFAELVKANNGPIHMIGKDCHPGAIGRALNRGVAACFAEVEVDTWTGDWKFIRAIYSHDAGHVMNPLLANASMEGSLVESTGVTTECIPWDKEFPGNRHYSVGYLSYRLPTIMDVPAQTQVFINSFEPRWFFGSKGFAETGIGAPPGALANAIYNACGVRIREHPISKDAIMAGLRTKNGGGITA